MPEAVIVSYARSPIGRANKGSLVGIRSDDLTSQMVKAALSKVPELDPTQIDDLMLGNGLPGGQQGFNMARVVSVLSGLDTQQALELLTNKIKDTASNAEFLMLVSKTTLGAKGED